MATGDTALPLALSSPPQHLLDNSPSNLSSPLSEVEDKYDDEHDEADLDMIDDDSHTHSTPKRNGAHGGPDSDLVSEPDEDSKLSEPDVNDSEAETERLYDTPPKNSATRDIVNPTDGTGIRRFTDRRERAFERSPSKLQQQLKAGIDAEAVANGTNTGSEEEEEAEDDDASMASGDRDSEPPNGPPQRSPTQSKKNQIANANESTVSQGSSDDSTESRKRKRFSPTEQSETEQPPKKRMGSIDPTDRELSADDTPMIDDEKLSAAPESGNHTAEEDNVDEPEAILETKGEAVESVEEDAAVIPRPKRGKRSPVKRRQSKSPEVATPQEAPDEPPEDGDAPSAVPTPQAEDHGDAEAALRNEEELERKRAAWDELTAIEKQFSNFRERLYQERLEQINREEEMLQGPSPTHPEYLAMLQCLEERRQEKIRLSQIELEFKMSVLNHRAVAERSQVMSQFYQSIRASREKTLELLGQDWHDVQQQRRRRTNVVPEFGLPFPSTKSLAVRQAVSYTREVSILSGFAKHVGFPAAPAIHGVTEEQLEDDLEAISNAREPVPRPVPNPLPTHLSQDLTTGFGTSLGPAGEQFIEQTPWANPRHPSHQQQRHPAWEQLASAGPSSAPRRYSQQPAGLFSSSTSTIPNGDSPVQMQKGFSPMGHDALKRSRMASEQHRREPAVHVS